MTAFIDPPREFIARRTGRQAAMETRPATEHDPGCDRPGTLVQARILDRGALIAHCRGCTAVDVIRGR